MEHFDDFLIENLFFQGDSVEESIDVMNEELNNNIEANSIENNNNYTINKNSPLITLQTLTGK